jgi:hypothetical protein
MTGERVRAADVGYRRLLGDSARLSVDYQWKTAPTTNDDSVNTHFQITLGVVF